MPNPAPPPRTLSDLDRFVLAFKRDCLNAAPCGLDELVRLYWDHPKSFHAAMKAAWDARRPGAFAELARVAGMNDDMPLKTAQRLVTLLLLGGRPREAIRVLQDPRFAMLEHGYGQLWLGRAQLALGRPEQAQDAIGRAVGLDGGLRAEAAELAPAIASLIDAQAAAAASKEWADARRLIAECLMLGAAEAAGEALRAFVARGRLEKKAFPDFHTALDAVLSLTGPEDGVSLFRAMERLYTKMDGQADLRLICDVLTQPDGLAEPPAWRTHRRLLRISGALAWARAGKLKSAILTLGQLSLDFPKEGAARAALARAVGQDFLARHPLRLVPRPGPRRIFDAFLFHDELRMLEIKLHEMGDWVDHFVLVEARQTHTGAPKPLVFHDNRHRFAAFAHKITHVVVDSFPDHIRHPWTREFHQREMGLLGLDGRCSEDDLVIISDVDEIVSRGAVEGFSGEYARLAMERARYFLNYREALGPDEQREAGSVWRAGYLPSLGLNYARIAVRADKRVPRLTSSGWHFTSVGDSEGLAFKVKHAAHQEHAVLQQDHFAGIIERLRRGELEPGWERCDLDDRFPAYIRDHRDAFEDLLL